jgi:hypothetical protein
LANKIIAIDKLQKSGILLTGNNTTRNKRKNFSYDKKGKRYFLPLVIKGQTIFNEEDKIHERIKQEQLKQRKKELLMQEKKFKRSSSPKEFLSKYPQNKEEYNTNKTLEILINKDEINMGENNKEFSPILSSVSKQNTEEIMNKISTSSGCGPHFLEAYCKIADKELEKMKEINKKLKEHVTIKYNHPGTYRAFTFKEKAVRPKPTKKKEEFEFDGNGENIPPVERDDFVEKKITEYYWSCCMNTDKNSPGCQKIEERNFKYLYD